MGSTSLYSHYSHELPLTQLFYLLQKSPSPTTLKKARQIHAFILISTPPTQNPFLFNNLLNLYAKCNSFTNAHQLFDTMPTRNLITYNTLISSFSKSPQHAISSFKLFRELSWFDLKPNASTFTSLAHASGLIEDPFVGAGVHCRVLASGFYGNVHVKTSVLGMYSDCGDVESADQVFDEMEERDSVAWNCMIFSYVRSGNFGNGLRMLNGMMRNGLLPNRFTLSIVLSACGRIGDWVRGRVIHAHVITSEMLVDNPLENALLDMYSSCNDLSSAASVFERIKKPDLVSWNSLISGFSNAGEGEKAMGAFVRLKALSRFEEMKPDEYTFAAIFSATAALPYIYYGKPLHAEVCKAGLEGSIFVGNTVVNMYFMNEDPCAAWDIFRSIPEKDVVIWTEMIVGYSRLGEGELAV